MKGDIAEVLQDARTCITGMMENIHHTVAERSAERC